MAAMIPRHKTFISYYHRDDQRYKNELIAAAQDTVFADRSVKDGDIDEQAKVADIRRIIRDDFLADATVTVVLVGPNTWRRKHVDWEIAASIRKTKNNSRMGLLGLLLPSRANYVKSEKEYQPGEFDECTIPPRLYKNIENGYAKLYRWTTSEELLAEWIHKAFERRNRIIPDNSYKHFVNNRSEKKTDWCA